MSWNTLLVAVLSGLAWLLPVTIVAAAPMPPAAMAPTQPPLQAKSLLQAGTTALQTGDYDLAVRQLTEALEQAPSSAAYSNRCLARIYLADYPGAVTDCTQALQLNPKQPESYLNRGLAYHRLGQPAEAIADYSQLLQLKPHDFRAYYNRGLAQVEQQAYHAAIVDYGEAIRQATPLDRSALAAIYNDRGLAELWLEHWPQAIADFTQAIQFNDRDLRAYYNRGCTYHQQGQLTAALQDFSQVLQIAPNHAQAYLSRGLLQQQLGNSEAALADLQEAAAYFNQQGAKLAYSQTLQLIQKLRVVGMAVG